MKTKSLLIGLGLTAAIVLLIMFINSSSASKKNAAKPAAAPPNVTSNIEGYVVKPKTINDIIQITGTLIPFEETELHSEVSGKVIKLYLPEGQQVGQGTMLIKLFDGDLQAQLRKLQVQLKVAEATESRQRELLKINGISQQDYDLSLLQVNNLKAEIDIVLVNIGKTEIRAPFSGTIGLKQISSGAYITPATAIATLRQTSPLKLDFSVPEKYSSLIRNGQKVNFKVEGSDQIYQASVIATEKSVTASTRNLGIRAVVSAQDEKLTPGTFAEIDLNFGENPNALMIPTQAVIPQARDKKVVVSRGGKAEFVIVKTGIRQSQEIQILDGLKKGDTIAITGILFIKPEGMLKFSKIK